MASHVATRKAKQVDMLWNDRSQVTCAETLMEIYQHRIYAGGRVSRKVFVGGVKEWLPEVLVNCVLEMERKK